jgi:hypothetical protein
MQITPLTALEAASCGFNTKISLTAADLVLLTSGTAASIFPAFNTAGTFAANCLLNDAMAVVKTAFTGGTGTLTFGVSDGTNQILATGLDLTTAGIKGVFNLTKPVMYTAAGAISITVTSQNAIANWSTGGEVDIYVNFVDVNTLNR